MVITTAVFTSPTATLTIPLPPEITFESASIPPLTTSPLTWSLNDIEAQTVGGTLTFTATLTNTVSNGDNIPFTIDITANIAEVELANNSQPINLFVGQRLYLPFIND